MSNKERPILFSPDMVRAILDGRKTQTRRVVTLPEQAAIVEADGEFYCADRYGDYHNLKDLPPYKDDILWVRETFRWADRLVDGFERDAAYYIQYKSDGQVLQINCENGKESLEYIEGFSNGESWSTDKRFGRWRPSIHMPRWASRLQLLITDVRYERLQEITEQDAVAEGIDKANNDFEWAKTCSVDPSNFPSWKNYLWQCLPGVSKKMAFAWPYQYSDYINPIDSFSSLWHRINAKRSYGWDTNPVVRVIEFEVFP